MVDTTDVDGRAQAAVRLGSVLGRAVVHVNVLEFGLRDSAVFTVTPGAPSVLRVQISSTVLDIGSTASLTATVHDRHGNLRPEVPTFSAGPGTAVTVDPVTGVVSAVGLGVQSVNAEYGTLRSSVTVRAAPAARLVVWNAIGADVRLINLNGAQPRTLRTSVASRLGTYPRFDPSRQSVTLHTATSGSISGTPDMVLVLDTLGVLQRSIGPDLTGFSTVIATRPIADGSILAVARRTTDAVGAFSLYRISSDNLVTPVVQLPQMGENYCGADISPDGSSVAYLASVAGKLELRIFTVSSGSFVAVEPDARCPRWSPQGDQLAFLVHLPSHSTLDGNLAVMNADGNGRRLLGDAVYAPGLAWSPDAKYLIGRPASSTFRLTRVSDAATMVFQLPADYYQPDWIK
jgi:hypothetical protein